jgi:hypothetical protein
MNTLKTLGALSVLCGLAAFSQAQYKQLYNGPRASFVSVVESCANPTPAPLAAADDFAFADNFVVNHFRWWGTVSNVAQLARTYYVAIYTNANCKPGGLVYSTCLIPDQTQFVAFDCQGKAVYNFYTALPAPLPIDPGHYWFRVAECDDDSVTVGAVDFQWSGSRPVRHCNAGQNDALGAFLQPLIDACDGLPDDLAFCVLG